MSLGGVQIQLGNYGQAERTFRQALELYPYDGRVMSNIGMVFFYQRSWPEALRWFEKADTWLQHYRIAVNLARAYDANGQEGRAREKCRTAVQLAQHELRLNPDDAAVHIMISQCYAMLGQRRAALAHVAKALDPPTRDPHYLAIAAMVHARLGDIETALDYVQAAVEAGYSPAEIRSAPELDPVRQHPRYIQIMNTRQTLGR